MNAHPTTCLCCLSLDCLSSRPRLSKSKKRIKCLKNECSLLFSFSSFYHFSGRQVCAVWAQSATQQFGFLCEMHPWLLSSTRGPPFYSKNLVCCSKVNVFGELWDLPDVCDSTVALFNSRCMSVYSITSSKTYT